MVSALFKACSEGNLETVQDLLKDVNPPDIEAKDESGSTPLIEAVKNGHVDVVRALLDKGADPFNASPSGPPEQHTTDHVILDLLTQAKNKTQPNGVPSTVPTYTHDGSDDPQKAYYPPPPPDAYSYYPTINPSLPTVSDGSTYYPPPPPHIMGGGGHSPGGLNNLPPPEIARLIPCRYFPACRYGPSCIFAHPTQGYYPNGGPPPAQYPPYDPMTAPPYPPNYYPPPPFPQANGAHPMAPLSPPPAPHMGHARSTSEVVSPSQAPFSPNGMPPPLSYGPMSPSAYPHPAQLPVPIPIPPLPALHHQPQLPPPGPQSPTNFTGSPAPPFNVQQDGSAIYPSQQTPLPNGNMNYSADVDGASKPSQAVPGEGFNTGVPPVHREGPLHNRRGGRRSSFNGRSKPPCLFFPAGRCKNGDDCRFPHVMPDNTSTPTSSYFGGRGGGPRQPRTHTQSNFNGHGTGLEEKFNNLNIRDENSHQQPASGIQAQPLQQNGQNGTDTSKLSNGDNGHGNGNGYGYGFGNRPRYPQGNKHHHHPQHGYPHHYSHHNGKNPRPPIQVPVKQRVPNADEFPVLAGANTPPSRSPLNSHGPTAAQVLQAPPPKKDSIHVNGIGKDSISSHETAPEQTDSPSTATKDPSKIEVNGVIDNSAPPEPPVNKLPISFAAIATSAVPPDMSKEVSVSA